MEGFLSTEDSNAPGNNALLDLVAALHWVKENIAAFGGDPDQVTLMGQGHGAALVNILMISPIAKGKLHCQFPLLCASRSIISIDLRTELNKSVYLNTP